MRIRVRKDLRARGFRPETNVGWLPKELMESDFEVDREGFIEAKRLEKDVCIRKRQLEFWANVRDFEPVFGERRESLSYEGPVKQRIVETSPDASSRSDLQTKEGN